MVVHFLYGRTIQGVQDSVWHGPEIYVDTEDQLELVLRLCPDALWDIGGHNYERWMDRLANCTEAVHFIPLIFQIYPDIGDHVDIADLSALLLNNDGVSKRSICLSDFTNPFEFDAATPERDEESFRAFVNLVAQYVLCKRRSTRILKRIVSRFLNTTIASSRSFDFMKERLQAFTTATLMRAEGENCGVLLSVFKDCNKLHKNKIGSDLRFYDLMLENGIQLYHPDELLGFGFHGRNLEVACDIFGKEPAKQVMNDKIASTLAQSINKNGTLQRLISKAATDESISLDGLYSLVRFDPSILQAITSKV